jgi:hypothetical protein
MVGLVGVEPTASSLSGMRSNQLSYRPGWRDLPPNSKIAPVLNSIVKKTPVFRGVIFYSLKNRIEKGKVTNCVDLGERAGRILSVLYSLERR